MRKDYVLRLKTVALTLGCMVLLPMSVAQASVDANCSSQDGEVLYQLKIRDRIGDRGVGIGQLAGLYVVVLDPNGVPLEPSLLHETKVRHNANRQLLRVKFRGPGLRLDLELNAAGQNNSNSRRYNWFRGSGTLADVALTQSAGLIDVTCTLRRGLTRQELKRIRRNQLPAEPVVCEGDLNSDLTVDEIDIAYVTSRLGCTPESILDCLSADANKDGAVDPMDYGYLYSRWEMCVPVE